VSKTVDLLVPDIGDFHDVAVIEVLVSPGASIKRDDPSQSWKVTRPLWTCPHPMPAGSSRFWSRWRQGVGRRTARHPGAR